MPLIRNNILLKKIIYYDRITNINFTAIKLNPNKLYVEIFLIIINFRRKKIFFSVKECR
jgi:hypothetical protein